MLNRLALLLAMLSEARVDDDFVEFASISESSERAREIFACQTLCLNTKMNEIWNMTEY